MSGPSNQANPLDQKDLEHPSKLTDFYLIPLYPRMDPDTLERVVEKNKELEASVEELKGDVKAILA